VDCAELVKVALESIEKGRGDRNCGFGRGGTVQSTRRIGLLRFVGEALALFRLGELVGSVADSVRFFGCVPKSIIKSTTIYPVGVQACCRPGEDM
jgi:hypothetical protein